MASGSPQRRRSSVNVGFQADADQFIRQEINYETWDHSIMSSDEATLRKFLQKQAEGEFDDLKLRLQTMRGEAEDIREHLNKFQNAADKLKETAHTYLASMHAEQQNANQTAHSSEEILQAVDKQKAEIQSTTDKKRDLMNDKNKELLGVTDKHLEKLLHKSGGLDPIQQFLLETFAKILHNDEKNDDWSSLLKDQLKDIASFQLAMRQAEGSNLSDACLDQIRQQISGDANTEASGKEAEKEDIKSRIYILITDEKNLTLNINYFPFYRVLSKTYHYIATLRKLKRHQEKEKLFDMQNKQIGVRVKAHEDKINALKEFEAMENEAKHIEANEVAYFQQKLDEVNGQISEITYRLSGQNFANEYFN